jgi:anti-sigma regulatory factor (Ser/Thr protein kinase)
VERNQPNAAEVSSHTEFSRRFPAEARAVGAARKWIGEVATATGHGSDIATLRLLVTELATNAIRYADGGGFTVRFDAEAHLLVAVCDPSSKLPRIRKATTEDTGGRGLAIVESMSDAWGAQVHADGKCVWFWLDRPPEEAVCSARPSIDGPAAARALDSA